jgi:hypothetical protein
LTAAADSSKEQAVASISDLKAQLVALEATLSQDAQIEAVRVLLSAAADL